MRILFIEHDTFAGPTNLDIWAEKQGHVLTRFEIMSDTPHPSPDDWDALVVSGAFQHAWDDGRLPWLAREKAYLRDALDRNKVVLGFCFGAQLLAEALGGEVYGADFPEIGWHEVSLTEDGRISPLFQGLPSTFTTFHWHGDHYRLPEGTVSLAASLITPNQAFLGPGGRSLGIQFHPEYTPTLVQTYAARHGHEWTPGPYVQSRSEVLERLDCLRDTYWLLSALMNNFQALTGLR